MLSAEDNTSLLQLLKYGFKRSFTLLVMMLVIPNKVHMKF